MTLSQSQYSELKNKIVEAVPEIMELKFGCEAVFIPDNGGASANAIIAWIQDDNFVTDNVLVDSGEYTLHKIIGRPIRLADVLRALQEAPYEKDYPFIELNPTYYGKDEMRISYKRDGACLWDLSKDSLDDQSDETKQFLYDLLCKPNN